jgi:hypothetical protein
LLKLGQAVDEEKRWRTFARKYRAEMNRPEKRRLLDLLAAMSRQTNFSVGCYCADESRCHRSLLRALLTERGALFALSIGSEQKDSVDDQTGGNVRAKNESSTDYHASECQWRRI